MHAAGCAIPIRQLTVPDVTAAVRPMDEMTQNNAALVEQTNAAIEQTDA